MFIPFVKFKYIQHVNGLAGWLDVYAALRPSNKQIIITLVCVLKVETKSLNDTIIQLVITDSFCRITHWRYDYSCGKNDDFVHFAKQKCNHFSGLWPFFFKPQNISHISLCDNSCSKLHFDRSNTNEIIAAKKREHCVLFLLVFFLLITIYHRVNNNTSQMKRTAEWISNEIVLVH